MKGETLCMIHRLDGAFLLVFFFWRCKCFWGGYRVNRRNDIDTNE